MQSRIKPLPIQWVSPDITELEWHACIRQLYQSWKDCECQTTTCQMFHEAAAILTNERNEHITQFMDARITADEWLHFQEILNMCHLAYDEWVEQQTIHSKKE